MDLCPSSTVGSTLYGLGQGSQDEEGRRRELGVWSLLSWQPETFKAGGFPSCLASLNLGTSLTLCEPQFSLYNGHTTATSGQTAALVVTAEPLGRLRPREKLADSQEPSWG